MARRFSPADFSFAIMLAFLCGVFSANMRWNFFLVVGAAMVAHFLLVFALKIPRWQTCILFTSVIVGIFYFHIYCEVKSAEQKGLPFGDAVEIQGMVMSEPNDSAHYELFSFAPAIASLPSSEVYAPLGSGIEYGDQVRIDGTIEGPLAAGGDPVIFAKTIEATSAHGGVPLVRWLFDIKRAFIQKLQAAFSADKAALAAGELFGSANVLPVDLKDAMEASGTSYIVTMFGYKIALLAATVAAALRGWVSRRIVFMLVLAAIILFVVMAGCVLTAVRAGIMVALALLAKESGRAANGRNALTFTAGIFALWNPTLFTDAAFELSFLSLLGMFYLAEPLKALLRFRDEGLLKWRECAIVALATNLAILPVVVSAFGSFSITSLVSNTAIAIPLPFVITLGALTGAAGFFSGYLSLLVARAAFPFLGVQIAVIDFFARYAVPLPRVATSGQAMFIYSAALIAFVFFYENDHALPR